MVLRDLGENYEIFLAAPFEKCETDGRNFSFYENLRDRLLEEINKKLYLPHKHLVDEMNPYPIVQEKIFNAELVLVDIGIPSDAAGMMIDIATNSMTGLGVFYKNEDYTPGQDLILDSAIELSLLPVLVLDDLKEKGVEQLSTLVVKAYNAL